MNESKSYSDYNDEADDKWERGAQKYEANRKEFNQNKMSKKKKIRVSEYARLVGKSPASIHDQINAGVLEFEMQGETRYVDYPEKSLIKYKPVRA